MFKRFALLLLALSLSLLTACTEPMTFSHAELYITLTDDFEETESEGYDLSLSSGDVSFGLIRISRVAAEESGISDTMSPSELAEFTLGEKGKTGACEIYSYSDIPYFTLYEQVGGREYYTLYTFYRSVYAYFIITFAVPRDKEAEYRETLLEYADTVRFESLASDYDAQ